MNLQAMLPVLLFLAGSGFNEVAYAIGRLQGQGAKSGGGGGAVPQGQMGIPQILQMLSGAMPQGQQMGQPGMGAQGSPGATQGQQPGQPNMAALQQLGPNPLQALAMLDLKKRMAMQGGMQ